VKCNNIQTLLSFIANNYPKAENSHPTALQTKIDFPDGLVVNIFNTGTVNFQGKSFENDTVLAISKVIDVINGE
jgi:hypothetical protein